MSEVVEAEAQKAAEEGGEQNAPEECGEQKRQETLFHVKKHIKYCMRVLNILPCAVSSLDTSRMTLAFFGLSGLDLLGALDENIPAQRKKEIIDWIYAHQIHPAGDTVCGFRGSNFVGASYSEIKEGSPSTAIPYDTAHITMTYTALACLLILGDDLSRVNRPAVLAGLRKLQLPNGSFYSTAEGSENDMRFVFCAACICYMLRDWSGMDTQKAVEFIKCSQGYDNGISQGPYMESHGGSTYCGVAALVLMGELDSAFSPLELEALKKWCLFRQKTGFQGRPNKPVDTCYSFWIGASLQLLGGADLVDREWNRSYMLSTQADYGGFAKWPDYNPDPLHTYLGVCGLSLNGEAGLGPVFPALNISKRAADWLHKLHANS